MAAISSSSAPIDAWHDSFNDISDAFASGPRARRQKRDGDRRGTQERQGEEDQTPVHVGRHDRKGRDLRDTDGGREEGPGDVTSRRTLLPQWDGPTTGDAPSLGRRRLSRPRDLLPDASPVKELMSSLVRRITTGDVAAVQELPSSLVRRITTGDVAAVPESTKLGVESLHDVLVALKKEIRARELRLETEWSRQPPHEQNHSTEEEPGPIPFPSSASSSQSYRETPVNDVVENDVVCSARENAASAELNQSAEPVAKTYKARTSPASSGLGGPLPPTIAPSRSRRGRHSPSETSTNLYARFDRTPEATNPFGVFDPKPQTTETPSSSSFRKAGTVSPDRSTSKTTTLLSEIPTENRTVVPIRKCRPLKRPHQAQTEGTASPTGGERSEPRALPTVSERSELRALRALLEKHIATGPTERTANDALPIPTPGSGAPNVLNPANDDSTTRRKQSATMRGRRLMRIQGFGKTGRHVARYHTSAFHMSPIRHPGREGIANASGKLAGMSIGAAMRSRHPPRTKRREASKASVQPSRKKISKGSIQPSRKKKLSASFFVDPRPVRSKPSAKQFMESASVAAQESKGSASVAAKGSKESAFAAAKGSKKTTRRARIGQHASAIPEKKAVAGMSDRIPRKDAPRNGQYAAMYKGADMHSATHMKSITPGSLQIDPLDVPQPAVPYLEYGLDRVLFNPGIYQLQDPVSRVFNFDPYLQKIMPITEFDFSALKQYKTSSKDTVLSDLARRYGNKYIGSTSSMTSSLAHFHYLLSNFRPINLDMLSSGFVTNATSTDFTATNRVASAIFLRWKNGTYAIDADKQYDSSSVLMMLGKSMELLLTSPKSEFERYRRSDPRTVSEEQRNAPESYQYTSMGDLLMRSQLDAYDPRLPGNGTFDLKTRAVVSVRMSADDVGPMTGYEISTLQGRWHSYEREMWDMMRSTMLKYLLQARMGRMEGIFVAYHNVERLFGFQYLPIADMDRALHGQSDKCLGDQEFKASLNMLNEVLNKATAKFPEQSLRIFFETLPQSKNSGDIPTTLHVVAEPMSEEMIDTIQNPGREQAAAYERAVMSGESKAVKKPTDVAAEQVLSESAEMAAETNNREDTVLGDEPDDLDSKAACSSDPHADLEFVDSIETATNGRREIFYATLVTNQTVNGQPVPDGRPAELSEDDVWEIDYTLNEYETGPHQWGMYMDMLARRQEKLEKEVDGGADDKRLNQYTQFLQTLAQKGRDRRAEIDLAEADNQIVRAEESLPRERERIEGVEDYMKWLYKS